MIYDSVLSWQEKGKYIVFLRIWSKNSWFLQFRPTGLRNPGPEKVDWDPATPA
jgi:hypothetical protein